jgi:hypothetical protein
MTLKEMSVSLNVSTDRVYYIFKKLGLKTQCKKEGGRWLIDERVFKEIKWENMEIQWRSDKRQYKKDSIRHEKMYEYAKFLELQSLCYSAKAEKLIERMNGGNNDSY